MNREVLPGSSRGQSLAEFALIMPVLLLLMMALFDIGRVVVAHTAITNAAREGARLAVVNQHVPWIEERVRGQTVIAEPDITVEFRESGPNPDAADNDPCSPIEAGCIVRVQVDTTIGILTPIIGNLLAPVDLTAETQMAVDFVCPSLIDGWTTVDSCPKKP